MEPDVMRKKVVAAISKQPHSMAQLTKLLRLKTKSDVKRLSNAIVRMKSKGVEPEGYPKHYIATTENTDGPGVLYSLQEKKRGNTLPKAAKKLSAKPKKRGPYKKKGAKALGTVTKTKIALNTAPAASKPGEGIEDFIHLATKVASENEVMRTCLTNVVSQIEAALQPPTTDKRSK